MLSIIRETIIQKFENKLIDFSNFDYNIKFSKYSDTWNVDKLDLYYFEWMNADTFDCGLNGFQSCDIWKQQFIDVKQLVK